MLSNIKKMISEKVDFMEAADLLMEEAAGNLDDLIVLGEEAEEEEGIPGPEDIEEGDEVEASEEENNGDAEDIMNQKIKNDPDSMLEDDIPEEEPLPLPGDNSVPAPSGDIMNDEIADDILSTNIDLRSNTPTDTLPIPPGGAGDAIEDNNDMLNQRIDSGFGGSDSPVNDLGSSEIPEEDSTPEPVSTPAAEEGPDVMDEEIDDDFTESSNEEDDLVDIDDIDIAFEGDANYSSEKKDAVKSVLKKYKDLGKDIRKRIKPTLKDIKKNINRDDDKDWKAHTISSKVVIGTKNGPIKKKAAKRRVGDTKSIEDLRLVICVKVTSQRKLNENTIKKFDAQIREGLSEPLSDLLSKKIITFESKKEKFWDVILLVGLTRGYNDYMFYIPVAVDKKYLLEGVNTSLFESFDDLDDLFNEAITIAGEEGGDDSGDGGDTMSEEIPDEGGEDSGESDVTTAVKDKVAESDVPDDGMGEDLGGDDLGGGGNSAESNENIMKRLSSLTKNIEDIKGEVVKAMNK